MDPHPGSIPQQSEKAPPSEHRGQIQSTVAFQYVESKRRDFNPGTQVGFVLSVPLVAGQRMSDRLGYDWKLLPHALAPNSCAETVARTM